MPKYASRPFVRLLERVSDTFLNRLATLPARDVHDLFGYLSARVLDELNPATSLTMRPVVVDGLAAYASGGMTVTVPVGMAFAPAAGAALPPIAPVATTEESAAQLVNKRSASVVTIGASGGVARFDLIEIEPAEASDISQVSDFWDVILKKFTPGGSSLPVVYHGEGTVYVVPGTPGSNGTPTPTSGRVPIAVVRVMPGAVAITAADVFDVRPLLTDLRGPRAASPNELSTEEFTVDHATAAGDAQVMGLRVEARVGGVPGGVFTRVPVGTYGNSGNYVHFDPTVHAGLATYTGWVYAYLVVTDDRGLRYSRSRVSNSVAPLEVPGVGDYDHRGVLVWTTTPPDLTNGSLAPGGTLTLPNMLGATTCSAGNANARAVCIGAAYWLGNHFHCGLRMAGGKAELVDLTAGGFQVAVGAYTWATEALRVSTLYADFDASGQLNPKGALALDFGLTFGVQNSADAGYRRTVTVEAKDRATSTGKETREIVEGVVGAGGASGGCSVLLRDFPVARKPTTRGTAPDGFKVTTNAAGSVSSTGHGIVDPASTAPVLLALGYRWPQGAIHV